MSEVVLTEIIEDMDRDNDGVISLEEYVDDIISEEDEPDIKESEKLNFQDNLDKDKDGYLSRDEVQLIIDLLQFV